ncbi:MAG: hypothetical protein U1E31_01790 [Rickettsiales bacterium]
MLNLIKNKKLIKYFSIILFFSMYCSSCAHKTKKQLMSPCVMNESIGNFNSPFYKHPCNFKPINNNYII